MNITLLRRLRAARGAFLAVDGLGPDRAATDRDLAEMEAFGFALERHPVLGVAYRGPADRLCPDQIEWGLHPRRVGRRIAVWDRVRSTNDLAARAAGSRANEGLVVLAEEQTAGRGRRGRSWSAPPRSSILMSALLFPPPPLDQPAWLTALGAVAVAEVIERETGRTARIKWPNDVRVEGRKLAGVLVERGGGSVLGIGLNVNVPRGELPEPLRDSTTSILRLVGRPADRSELARRLIVRLDELYAQGLDAGPEPLIGLWRTRFEPIGRAVRVRTASATFAGRLVEADLQRGLVLEGPGDGRGGAGAPIPPHEILALTCDDERAGTS